MVMKWPFMRGKFSRFFDREDALAVLGIAFCQSVFFHLSVGLLTIVSRSFFVVWGCFNNGDFFCLGVLQNCCLDCKDKIGSDR